MIVTIDGPAGAGKSTAARDLARRLGFHFLDTGAMYRAVTLHCLRLGVDLRDEPAVAAAARGMPLEFRGALVLVAGSDVTQELRSNHVTQESRFVAAHPAVRAYLVDLQRQLAAGRNVVTEGRDQGTVAFPAAECKFYLTASPRQRALRRQREFAARGEQVPLDQILDQITSRDERDSLRDVGPLKAAEDALVIDTSELSTAAVLDLLEGKVRERMPLQTEAAQ